MSFSLRAARRCAALRREVRGGVRATASASTRCAGGGAGYCCEDAYGEIFMRSMRRPSRQTLLIRQQRCLLRYCFCRARALHAFRAARMLRHAIPFRRYFALPPHTCPLYAKLRSSLRRPEFFNILYACYIRYISYARRHATFVQSRFIVVYHRPDMGFSAIGALIVGDLSTGVRIAILRAMPSASPRYISHCCHAPGLRTGHVITLGYRAGALQRT